MYSYSKLGKKYLKADIEKTDDIYHKELRKMYKNENCIDCNNKIANWVTLKRGKFICINCAQSLREDALNKIKSCMGTYLWHPDEMQLMRDNYNK